VDFGQGGRIGRYVRMVALPGKGSVLATKLLTVAEGMRGAPGCELYVVNLASDEPDTVWVTEVWYSEESHRASLTLPAVRDAIARGRPLIAGFDSHTVTAPVGGVGLPASGS